MKINRNLINTNSPNINYARNPNFKNNSGIYGTLNYGTGKENVFAEFNKFPLSTDFYYSLKSSEAQEKSSNQNPIQTKRKLPYIIASVAAFCAVAFASGLMIKKLNNVKNLKDMYKKIINEFPEDKEYYSTLAKEVGLKPKDEYKLCSIVGSSQMENLLKIFTPQDFQVGKNYEGIANHTFRVSLHNHTTASDGILTVEELLEQATKWADRVAKNTKKDLKPPFTIAITDHDTLASAKEAVKIIAKNPQKYKNLKVVLGSEISVSHLNPENVIRPVDFELIGYSLNPFNEKLNRLLNNLENSRRQAIETLLSKIGNKYGGYGINLNEAKSFHANIKNVKTNGVLYLAGDYAEFKIKLTDYVNKINKELIPETSPKLTVNEIFSKIAPNYYLSVNAGGNADITSFIKNKGLKPILEQRGILNFSNNQKFENIFNADYSSLQTYIKDSVKEGLPTISDKKGYCILPEDVFNVVKSKKEGFFGMAHPAQINLNSPNGDNISNARKLRLGMQNENKNLVFEVFNDLKQKGKELFCATEVNYQSYKSSMGRDWIDFMKKDIADNPLLNLYYTGGTDTHAPSIFNKHTVLPKVLVDKYKLQNITGDKYEYFTDIIESYKN